MVYQAVSLKPISMHVVFGGNLTIFLIRGSDGTLCDTSLLCNFYFKNAFCHLRRWFRTLPPLIVGVEGGKGLLQNSSKQIKNPAAKTAAVYWPNAGLTDT